MPMVEVSNGGTNSASGIVSQNAGQTLTVNLDFVPKKVMILGEYDNERVTYYADYNSSIYVVTNGQNGGGHCQIKALGASASDYGITFNISGTTITLYHGSSAFFKGNIYWAAVGDFSE